MVENGTYPPTPWGSSFLRRYLVSKFGEKCSRCGWAGRNVATGRVMLEVEHINGNWKDNRAENITLLCPNCHSLTPTFKALNKGHGREARQERRKRIANGLATGRDALRSPRMPRISVEEFSEQLALIRADVA